MKSKLLTIIIVFLLSLTFISTSVQAVDTATYQKNCPSGSISADCQPLQLSDAQVWAVQLIGTAYAAGGFLFMAILMYNGAIYMIGTWEESKYILGASLEDVQKRMFQWLLGVFIFFLSWPFMNTILKLVVADNECYGKLNAPVVQFVFPDVCNFVAQVTPTPTNGTPTNATPTNAVPTVAPTLPAYTKTCWEVDFNGPNSGKLVPALTTDCKTQCNASGRQGLAEFSMTTLQSPYTYLQCNCNFDLSTCIGVR